MSHYDIAFTIVCIYGVITIIGIIMGIGFSVEDNDPGALILIPLSIIWPLSLMGLCLYGITKKGIIPLYYKRGYFKRMLKAWYWESRANVKRMTIMPDREQNQIFLNYLKGLSYQNDATKELIAEYERKLGITEEKEDGETFIDEGAISIAEAEETSG